MTAERPTQCLNCGHSVGDAYCPHCGQKNTSYRVSLWLVLKEMAGEAFELDGRVPRTFVPFFFKPGFLTREYNAGRRASYTSPFRLFLAMMLLWASANFVVNETTDPEVELRERDASGTISFGSTSSASTTPSRVAFTDENSLAFAKRLEHRMNELQTMPSAEVTEEMIKSGRRAIPKAMLVLLPIFGLILKLLFLGSGRFYVEHVVFALHIHAMAFFFFALGLLVDDGLLALALLLGFGAYVFIAVRNAYGTTWWPTTWRFLALLFVYSGLAVLVSGLVLLTMLLL